MHPPDHGRVEAAREAGRPGLDADQPVDGNRLVLPLQLDGRQPRDGHRVAGEGERLGADQDLARRGRLLKPRRHVHRVAGSQPLLRPRDDLSGVDAHPELEPHPVVALELGAETLDQPAQLVGRPHRAYGVVLMYGRHAKHRHHGVADELLDCPSVAHYHTPRLLEVAREHPSEALRVELLPERRRPGDVGEHDRHGLAMLLRRGRLGQSRSAGVAEARMRAVLCTTRSAWTHPASLTEAARESEPRPYAGRPGPRIRSASRVRTRSRARSW